MTLLMDLGNTCFKWKGGDAQGSVVHKGDDLAALLNSSLITLSPPAKIALSNVAGDQLEKIVIDWCSLHWPEAKLILAKVKNPVPALASNYRSDSLGVDRWLAMLAIASNKNSVPFIVVDCGSAVTIDAVNGASVHTGGVIMPGLSMLHASLVAGADAIQKAPTATTSVMAVTTDDALSAGCINTLVAGVDAIVNKMKIALKTDEVACYLTGGDVDEIQSLLKTDVLLKPELVFDGLMRYVKLVEL